jgi:hypothetical protein
LIILVRETRVVVLFEPIYATSLLLVVLLLMMLSAKELIENVELTSHRIGTQERVNYSSKHHVASHC